MYVLLMAQEKRNLATAIILSITCGSTYRMLNYYSKKRRYAEFNENTDQENTFKGWKQKVCLIRAKIVSYVYSCIKRTYIILIEFSLILNKICTLEKFCKLLVMHIEGVTGVFSRCGYCSAINYHWFYTTLEKFNTDCIFVFFFF